MGQPQRVPLQESEQGGLEGLVHPAPEKKEPRE